MALRDVDMSDTEYAGGLSTLTRYGSMNVSTSRIPRKRRSKGNKVAPRDRTIGLTPVTDGNGNVVHVGKARRAYTPTPRAARNDHASRYAAMLKLGNGSDAD